MDTPRRGLIRATERVIKEYIQDGCEKNLDMIRCLEKASYQVWVESNTAFLDESFVSSDDEDDGWIWDEDYIMGHSSPEDDTATESTCEDDDSSSIGSSICACEGSGCFHGYLASSEMDTTVGSIGSGSNFWNVTTTGCRPPGCIPPSGRDNSGASRLSEPVPQCSTGNTDDWVIVDGNCANTTPVDDWLVVSTAFGSESSTNRTGEGKVSETSVLFDIDAKPLSQKEQKLSTTNYADWAVISMKITEREKTNTCINGNYKQRETTSDKTSEFSDTTKCSAFNGDRKVLPQEIHGLCHSRGDSHNKSHAVVNSDQNSFPCMLVYVLLSGHPSGKWGF